MDNNKRPKLASVRAYKPKLAYEPRKCQTNALLLVKYKSLKLLLLRHHSNAGSEMMSRQQYDVKCTRQMFGNYSSK